MAGATHAILVVAVACLAALCLAGCVEKGEGVPGTAGKGERDSERRADADAETQEPETPAASAGPAEPVEPVELVEPVYKGHVIRVSPDGSDEGKGTPESPFATLERARDAIRELKKARGLPEGGVTVELRGGVYERSGPFELTAEDSGAEEAPVVYRGRQAEEARIVGGKVVTGFRPVTDPAVLARLDERARGNVLEADLKAQGITDYGKLTQRGFAEPGRPSHMELFFGDRPMTLARWPNDGYARIARLPDGKDARRFGYEGDRPRRWKGEADLWVYGYWYHDWADTYIEVESLDVEKRTIQTKAKHRYGLRKGHRWHVLNCLAELDSPGEYYVDRRKGTLYFWPPKPVGEAKAVVSVAEKLITMKETMHVTVRGMILEACRGTAVRIDGGEHNRIVGCTIRNIGNKAVSVSGRENAVVGCDIHETGDGGISLHGGDRKTLTPARLLAENNVIHDYSRWCHTYRPAVGVGGCGNVVRHNLIYNGRHNGIQLGGNYHMIEMNETHSTCYDTGDVGAFYMGRDWTARGTVIRHNYWHHIRGPGRHGAMGVYLDDQASGITIYGNVFHKVTRAAFIGGGCDNVVENNVFVDCDPAVHIDARGLGWQKKTTDDPKWTLRRLLRSMPYKNELWSRRFPNLPGILDDDPGTPKRNRIARNVSVGGRWEDIHAGTRKLQVIEDNLVDKDPQFVDRAGGDFRLKPTSPAFALGFEPIPFEKIGVYEDETRASWPVEHRPREVPKPEAARKVKPATRPAPVYVARPARTRIRIDANLDRPEWFATSTDLPMILKEDLHGDDTPRWSNAWAFHDGKHLYVAFKNTVLAKPPLRRGQRWGQDDAVEIAIRNASAGGKQPILVLRGYVDGTFESSDEAGAPADAVAKARRGVKYAAGVASATLWTCEWRIPFASLGIDPARHRRFAMNLTVRKTADDLWIMWRSTRGMSWLVDRAGVLKLAE